ncbi:hypothetical protein CRG98_027501 [Punica granatum]|uniref:Uncharacterized protein n=1 Tax=Punica granatum TaxID=22663 RepID=A0A2I0J764_PUNGR|nr:hypothetical protein CRG98_027501 [Punica granatum]
MRLPSTIAFEAYVLTNAKILNLLLILDEENSQFSNMTVSAIGRSRLWRENGRDFQSRGLQGSGDLPMESEENLDDIDESESRSEK